MWRVKVTGIRSRPWGGYAYIATPTLLMWRLIVRIMGSDVHIRAMWVREADDQPAACICCSCLICSNIARRGSLIDPDIQ